MTVKAIVAVSETEHTYPMQFDTEPKPGDLIKLTVDNVEGDYVVIDVDPTGFSDSAPYLYGVYVKPR